MKPRKKRRKARLFYDPSSSEPSFYQHPYGVIRRRYYAVCQYNLHLDDCYIVAICLTEASAKAEFERRGGKELFISSFYVSNVETSPPIEIEKVCDISKVLPTPPQISA